MPVNRQPGSSSRAAANGPASGGKMTVTPDDHKTIARHLLEELWSSDDADLTDDLFTADFLHHNAPGSTPRGPEAQKQVIPAITPIPPPLRITVDDLISEDARLAARWAATYLR